MNSLKKKSGAEVKPILKDKDKEDTGLALQLVPEYVDKRSFNQGNFNPNYVFAGALYIPRDIIQIVNANDTGAAKIYKEPVRDDGNVSHGDEQSVAIEDPDVRKYINRILRYFKYDPEEAMATLREASFKIKNRARGIVKKTYSQNTVSKLQAWRAKLQYSEGESEEELPKGSPPVIDTKGPVIQEDDKDEELNKKSFIQKTINRIFPTKSIIKIDKVQKEISSSVTPHSSEGERSLRKKMKWKTKKSKSMSQLINEGNKQVTGTFYKETDTKSSKNGGNLSSVTTDPEEKKEHFKKIKILYLNNIIPYKVKKLIIILKTICLKKRNNKAENNPTNFIYSDMYLNYKGASVKKKSLECEVYTSRQDGLLLSFLTAPRIHYCNAYTIMILNNENSRNSRSQNRKRALKKMKKRLQRLESLTHHDIEVDRFYNPCSRLGQMARKEKVLHLNRMLPNQQAFARSDPCFGTYNSLGNRTNSNSCVEFRRQSVDIIADTFVNVIESPSDPKCKVEITGQGYRGKFNVGLDPIIDEVLYNSLQNLKETYDNAKCYYETPTTDRRRNSTLLNIADNVRSYFSKVAGKNSSGRRSTTHFPSENIIGRTSIHRGETERYEEDTPAIFYEDANMKLRRCRCNNVGRCAPRAKISRYFIDNEKNKCQPKYTEFRNFRRAKKRRNINSSGSESFEERQFVRKTKGNAFPVLESSDNSFILREASYKIDEANGVNNKRSLTGNQANKKKTCNIREVSKERFSPDLSYISEKDWKAADQLLIKEREAERGESVRYTSLDESKCQKFDEQSMINSPMANNKVVKVKETMTTTTNGVTTVTQTEIIEAINRSSQCIIPSTSKEGLTARKEFNTMAVKHNECRQESNARLVNMTHKTQRHLKTSEEVTSPYKIVVNKESSQMIGHPKLRSPRECRCCEAVDEKHYLTSTISLDNLRQPDPNGAQGYNETLIINQVELSGQKDFRKCAWRKEYCHCNPNTENNYSMSKETSMIKQHLDITDLNQRTLKDTRKNVPLLHKVHSAPNTCHSKAFHKNSIEEVDNKMCIQINALKEIERGHISKRKKDCLKEWSPNEKSKKKEFKMPEEVIVTESGKAKIRVSLGSCDTSQRQQAFLELMEVLKRKIESETQSMTSNSHFHTMALHDFDDHAAIKSYQPIQANRSRNSNSIKKDAFKGKEKTATVSMMTSTGECRRSRMRLCTSNLKNFEVTTNKRKPTMYCYRPCYCGEKRKSVARPSNAQQIRNSLQERPSESLSLPNEDVAESVKRQSFAQQTGDSLLERPSGSISLANEDVRQSVKSQRVPVSVQTDDLGLPSSTLNSIHLETMSLASLSPDDEDEDIPVSEPKYVSVSVQTDNLDWRTAKVKTIPGAEIPKEPPTSRKSSTSNKTPPLKKISDVRRTRASITSLPSPDRLASLFSRKSGSFRTSRSRPRIKTGSLFSKSSPKGSVRASRQSERILLEKFPKTTRKPSISKTKKKDLARKSSGRETIRSSRGTLFVRRSTVPSVEENNISRDSRMSRQSRESRQLRKSRESRKSLQLPESRPLRESPELRQSKESRRSSVINRVWIQNLSVPVKYTDRSEVPNSQKLKEVSNVYYRNETGNPIVNSKSKRMSNRRLNSIFSKKKRNYFASPYVPENNLLSRHENGENSICPNQRKNDKFIVAPIRKSSNSPGTIDSLSLISYKKSSSFIQIIKDPDSVEDNIPGPSPMHSRISTDSTSSIISKCVKESIISSDTVDKSNSSLLSYEESPSLVEYVENFQYHSASRPRAEIGHSICNSSENYFIGGNVINSKPQQIENSNAVNKTNDCNHAWPCNNDIINLQCFPETEQAVKTSTDSTPLIRKKPSTNELPGHSTMEENYATSSGTRYIKGQKSSTSGSSDSKTTVISGPIVYKKHLAVRLQNFINKPPGAFVSSESNKSLISSKEKGISIVSSVSGSNNSIKRRFKRCNTQIYKRRIQPDLRKINSRSVVQTASSDDTEISDDSNSLSDCDLIEFKQYSLEPASSDTSTEQPRSDSNFSGVFVEAFVDRMTTERCVTETVNSKKHNKKSNRGRKLFNSKDFNSINSTLCINDDNQNAEYTESDGANRTTIGFDSSSTSLKEGNSKVAECYKVRAIDETIRSSRGGIVNSSETDPETSVYTEYSYNRSKTTGKNSNTNNTEYLMMTTDLQQSSSELLAKNKNTKRTFVLRKHTFINKEFDRLEKSKKLNHSLLRKKMNPINNESNDGLSNTSTE